MPGFYFAWGCFSNLQGLFFKKAPRRSEVSTLGQVVLCRDGRARTAMTRLT